VRAKQLWLPCLQLDAWTSGSFGSLSDQIERFVVALLLVSSSYGS
jgi:hypothetical protein